MSQPAFECSVRVQYLPERSDPENEVHAFAYTVTIVNSGDITAQLIARHWTVRDANGRVEEVRGLAVVGEQPVLAPGQRYQYTSWTRIATVHGSMRGRFYCMTEHAEAFEAPVPEFALVRQDMLH